MTYNPHTGHEVEPQYPLYDHEVVPQDYIQPPFFKESAGSSTMPSSSGHHEVEQQQLQQQPHFGHPHHHTNHPPPPPSHLHHQLDPDYAAAAAAAIAPSSSTTFIGRCPSLDFEFLWRRYQKARVRRRGPEDDFLSPIRLESMQNEQGFPPGLAYAILQHAQDCPIRLWLLDNSGTMQHRGGRRVATTTNTSSTSLGNGMKSSGKNNNDNNNKTFSIKVVDCTLWEEVQSTVLWHAEMAAWCQTPLALRMVHDPGVTVGPQQVGVSASKTLSGVEEVERLRRLLRSTRPSGGTTPLNQHLQDILSTVQEFIPHLSDHRRSGGGVRINNNRNSTIDEDGAAAADSTPWATLVICTDGLPTDRTGQETPYIINQFVHFIRELQELGICIVIRLSTDDEKVVQFYRTLNLGGEGPRGTLPILDDYVRECQDIQKHNPWLNYGLPLHLCREQGISTPVLEAMNHRPLEPMEVCELIQLLFRQELPATALGATTTSSAGSGGGDNVGGGGRAGSGGGRRGGGARRSTHHINTSTTTTRTPDSGPELMSYEEHLLLQNQEIRAQEEQAQAAAAQQMNYKKFRSAVEDLNKASGLLWNPVKQKFVPWMDLKKLDQLYKRGGKGGMFSSSSSNRVGGCIIS